MAYTKQTWIDGESVANAERLNHIEQGIYETSQKSEISAKIEFYPDWGTTYTLEYNLYAPYIVIVVWGSSIAVYSVLYGRVLQLNKTGSDTINYTIDSTNQKITFNLSNTGIFRVIGY